MLLPCHACGCGSPAALGYRIGHKPAAAAQVSGNASHILIQPPSSGPPALVIYANIPACAAVLHVIDAVLEPAATA